MQLAIIGATGRIGGAIAAEALARGHAVRALTRPCGTAPARGATAVPVNLGDPLSIAVAAAGADVLVSAFRPRDGDFADYLRVAETLVAALRLPAAAGLRLIVVGGASSLRTPDGTMVVDDPGLAEDRKPEMRGQVAVLGFLRGVDDVAWTYLSPSRKIAPGVRTGRYRLGGDDVLVGADGRSAISDEDYAVALVDEAQAPAHLGRRFTVGY